MSTKMPPLQNPLPHIADAADAASKIVSLQAQMYMLKQEIKAVQQIKRFVWLGVGIILLNLLLTLTFYWIQVGLHEQGWSAFTLALFSILFFGVLAATSIAAATRMGPGATKEKK